MNWGPLFNAVFELFKRSSFVSFALATASLATGATFVALAHLGPVDFLLLYRGWGVWFWLAAVFLYVLAAFLRFRERYARTVHFVPDDNQCFAHCAPQQDGRVFTQIAGHFQVFSRVDHAVRLLQVRLGRPYKPEKTLPPVLFTRAQNSHMYGSRNAIPGNLDNSHSVSESEVGFTLFYEGDITPGIRKRGITLEISDHLGNWHKVKFPHLQIR